MPMNVRTIAVLSAAVVALTGAAPAPATAQEATIAAPALSTANYDPQLSAKEAVLANWELAASGILAGHVVGRQVVALTQKDLPYASLARQAKFAEKTILQRYNSAAWIYASGDAVSEVDAAGLRAIVLAVAADCAADDCPEERAALASAFARATEDLAAAAATARRAIDTRKDTVDAILMAEQLTVIADYLDSGAWAENLTLAEFGREGEEVAARIVGTMALWKNVEPYVGLTDPQVDAAINAAARNLLRTLRVVTRSSATLEPAGADIQRLEAAAKDLAVEFRRAAALFSA